MKIIIRDKLEKGLPYNQETVLQKKYGVGGFFAQLFCSAMPVLIKGSKTVRREALRAVR